jgi:hypothetical protein
VLNDFWVNTTLDRARATMQSQASWPAGLAKALPTTQSLRYVTADEAKELQAELVAVLDRYRARNDDPSRRPPGALPIEFLLLAYPLLNLVGGPGPASGEASEDAESNSSD